MNKNKYDWQLSHDYIVFAECEHCGATHDDGESENDWATCPSCGEEDSLVFTTAHEDEECACCGHVFDMWEDSYINYNDLHRGMICEDCYKKEVKE